MTEKAIRRTRHWLAFDFLAVSAAEKRRGERKEAKRCLSEASSFCPARTEHRREPAQRAVMFAQRFW